MVGDSFEYSFGGDASCLSSCRLQVSVFADGCWHAAGGSPPSNGGHAGDFTVLWNHPGVISLVVKRRDGARFRAERVRMEVVLPLWNYGGVIVPDCGRHYVNSPKAIDLRLNRFAVHWDNAGHPFFALDDEAGAFAFGCGLLNVAGSVEFYRTLPRMSQRKAVVGGDENMALAFQWAGPAGEVRTLTIELFAPQAVETWFHALRHYGQLIQQHEEIHYPSNPDAWNPTWCTWTAFGSNDMTADRILGNARVARDLGIGTIIIDDGWFGAGLDDEAGDVNLGDYAPDGRKFPDFPGTIAAMQEMGLRVLLWHAPICVARGSKAYKRLRHCLIRRDGREFVSVNDLALLCPSCPEVRAYVADETERLLREYGIDGLKVDLYNCLPPGPCESSEHEHDPADPLAALEACMAAQWERARSVRSDVLLELKQDYGNVRLARYGTMVRAGDTAYDLVTNCRRCFYSQAYVPCVHNDYLVAGLDTRPESMSMMMIQSLVAGVPTFSIDLPALGEPLRAVIRRWLDFYRANRTMFEAARQPQSNDMAAWQGGTATDMWVAALWSCREVRLPEAEHVFVMNATARDDLYVRTAAPRRLHTAGFDALGRALPTSEVDVRDGMRLRVPSGGLAIMSRSPHRTGKALRAARTTTP